MNGPPLHLTPEIGAVREAFAAGKPVLVQAQLIADLETPVSAYLKLGAGDPHCFLFESVTGGETRGRYSFITLKPDRIWRCRDGRPEIAANAAAHPDRFDPDPEHGDPIASLRAFIAAGRFPLPEGAPPMASCCVGYLGYEMVRAMERLPDAPPDALGVPDAMILRPTLVAVFDTVRDQLTVATTIWPDSADDADSAFATARARIEECVAKLAADIPSGAIAAGPADALPEAVSNTGHARYLDMVARAKDYIRAGDAFQIVASHRFKVAFPLPPFALYRALRRLNPSPFMFFLPFRDFAVVGASPEILVRVREGTVTIRPIAGTRPRGRDAAADAALAADLLEDAKERAEHLMLLDLGRNDVGRVAVPGSVKVTESFTIERYSHVMHIVSNVEGTIAPGRDALDALIGGFPAGTLTGAPKVRAMEIIDELEVARRNIYAGAVGYFSADGSMDTCIVLRTAVVKDGAVHVQAGGGIVADSDPEAEWTETVNKARAVVAAAGEALRVAALSANRV